MMISIVLMLAMMQQAAPDTLKNPPQCPKYQHWQELSVGCSQNGSFGFCDKIIPAQCVDDMHMVTEREWQELMNRIEVLEKVAHYELRPK
jgi:hypothetical protein